MVSFAHSVSTFLYIPITLWCFGKNKKARMTAIKKLTCKTTGVVILA